MKNLIKKVIRYIQHDIWEKDDTDFKTKNEMWLARQIRIILYTSKGVVKHGSTMRSAALTFYTVMAIVPIVALAFVIVRALGLDADMANYLTTNFPNYSDLINYVIEFADSILIKRSRGGMVTIVSISFLLWATVSVFSNIENAFNIIWEVKKKRTVGRKIGAYSMVLFLIPIFFISMNSLISFAKNEVDKLLPNSVSIVIYTLGMVAMVWAIFTVIYTFIPNTKVKFRYSASSALVSATAFVIFQFIYLYMQNGISTYNIVYGSFASIPLFLLWVQTSWRILLFGGELSFSYQNISNYMQDLDIASLSYDSRRKITISVLYIVIKDFATQGGGVTSKMIADELQLSVRIIRDVLYDLEKADLILSARLENSDKVNVYLPSRDIHNINLYSAIQGVENTGTDINEEHNSECLMAVSELIDKIRALAEESDFNIPVIDLIPTEEAKNNKLQ